LLMDGMEHINLEMIVLECEPVTHFAPKCTTAARRSCRHDATALAPGSFDAPKDRARRGDGVRVSS
jgi:hypothetical protein